MHHLQFFNHSCIFLLIFLHKNWNIKYLLIPQQNLLTMFIIFVINWYLLEHKYIFLHQVEGRIDNRFCFIVSLGCSMCPIQILGCILFRFGLIILLVLINILFVLLRILYSFLYLCMCVFFFYFLLLLFFFFLFYNLPFLLFFLFYFIFSSLIFYFSFFNLYFIYFFLLSFAFSLLFSAFYFILYIEILK